VLSYRTKLFYTHSTRGNLVFCTFPSFFQLVAISVSSVTFRPWSGLSFSVLHSKQLRCCAEWAGASSTAGPNLSAQNLWYSTTNCNASTIVAQCVFHRAPESDSAHSGGNTVCHDRLEVESVWICHWKLSNVSVLRGTLHKLSQSPPGVDKYLVAPRVPEPGYVVLP